MKALKPLGSRIMSVEEALRRLEGMSDKQSKKDTRIKLPEYSAVNWSRDVTQVYGRTDEIKLYGAALEAFRRQALANPLSLHEVDDQGRPIPATLYDIFKARVEDYDTFRNPDGSTRTDKQRKALWKQWFCTSSDIVYKGGTTKFKLTQKLPRLLEIPEHFTEKYFDVDYDSVTNGQEFDSNDSDVNEWLTRSEFLASSVWDYLIPDQHVKTRTAEIIFNEFGYNTATKLLAVGRPNKDHGRTLFVDSTDSSCTVYGNISLYYEIAFLRVAQENAGGAPKK